MLAQFAGTLRLFDRPFELINVVPRGFEIVSVRHSYPALRGAAGFLVAALTAPLRPREADAARNR